MLLNFAKEPPPLPPWLVVSVRGTQSNFFIGDDDVALVPTQHFSIQSSSDAGSDDTLDASSF